MKREWKYFIWQICTRTHTHKSTIFIATNVEIEQECATELFENCENQFKISENFVRFISDFNLLGQLQHHFSNSKKKKVYELRNI